MRTGPPRADIRLERLASGRIHLTLIHVDGWSMLCAAVAWKDLEQVARDEWREYVCLYDAAQCDHGPTDAEAEEIARRAATPIEQQLGLR